MTPQERPEPSLIVLSENVLTMARDGREADGVAVRNGRIVALVQRSEVEGLRGPETQVHDVGARPLMPGFVDVHAHGEVACRAAYGTVDCRAPECESVGDVLEKLSAGLGDAEHGWVVGQANLFFDRKLREGRLPTREELDSVSKTSPIALRAGGHITVLNTRALELAGIDDEYRPPENSITGKPIVVRDGCGCATGVVKEMDNILPFPPQDRNVVREAIRTGFHSMFTSHGVTAVGEISETVEGIECMDELAREGALGTRVLLYLWAPGTMSLGDACNWQEHFTLGSEGVAVQGIKLFADGGYSAKSAAVKQAYLDDRENFGEIALTREFVATALKASHAAGLQLAIHANGDRAQEWLCEVIGQAGGSPGGRIRTRIEHAGNFLPEPSTANSWTQAGIIPVPQPVFLYTFGDFFPDYLGDYGTLGRFPFRALLDDGWRLSGSSDVWVGSERDATNPLFSVWCCVRRQAYSGRVIDPEQAITVEEALRMHTLDAAWVLGEQDRLGSLEPGKAADMIVLDRDPRTVPVDDLPALGVDAVYLAGKVVHSRPGARELA